MAAEPLAVLLGRNVRAARLRLGLTQDGLADLSGLHRNYVGGVERGGVPRIPKGTDGRARA